MRGKVFTRLHELSNEAYFFLTERRHELAANTDPEWFTKLLYLSCIFEKINSLNLSLQGESIDILKAYNKIKAFFQKKIQHWASRVEIERMDMFSELNDYFKKNEFNRRNVKQSIF